MTAYQDLYIIKWLLQNCEEPHSPIVWHQREPRAYFARYFAEFGEGDGKVCVEIGTIPTRTGGRVFTKFSSPGLGEVHVLEPIQSVFSLRRKFDTPEETELSDTMNRLLAVASSQHAARELRDMETTEERKQAIFRRLMGGNEPNN